MVEFLRQHGRLPTDAEVRRVHRLYEENKHDQHFVKRLREQGFIPRATKTATVDPPPKVQQVREAKTPTTDSAPKAEKVSDTQVPKVTSQQPQPADFDVTPEQVAAMK
ncbi:MAG: hypothetical protein HY914_13160 [Desulfomonile tiedjei]|nr:hypothetical protein [Desulfomonile tiedjei]